jgi:subtilisin family serine protease
VLLEPPPAGTPWSYEEPPVVDALGPVEAAEALQTAPWTASSADGTGVRVAVFDVQWFDAERYAAALGTYTTHDCEAHDSCDPAMDTLRPRYAWEEGAHGVACAATVRALAPGAELHLVRVNGPSTLESAAAWAIREEIDVVSMSMSFFNESAYDGTGSVSASARNLADAGIAFLVSAGNYAKEHWDGPWFDPDGDDLMDFPWGSEYLPVKVDEGGHSAYVAWDQYAACGDVDFDVLVYRRDGSIVGRGDAVQATGADHCSPVERVGFTATEDDWHWIQVRRVRGDPSVHLSVFARGAEVYGATPGSTADPASDPSSFTVAAVHADGYATNGRASYSSTGPTMAGDPKPDLAGPDGLSGPVFGPRGFYGTSAATPAVAGALALALSAEPELSPRQGLQRLVDNALGGSSTWSAPSGDLGAGKARLWDPASGEIPPCGGASPAAALPCLLWWRRFRRSPPCAR